jgi:hypothetical protein
VVDLVEQNCFGFGVLAGLGQQMLVLLGQVFVLALAFAQAFSICWRSVISAGVGCGLFQPGGALLYQLFQPFPVLLNCSSACIRSAISWAS